MNDGYPTSATDSAPTRILQIVGNAIVGGMENYVARLVERLPRERFEIFVLAPFESPFTDQLRGFGTDVFITSITDEPSWQSIQLASALIQTRRVDLIHSHLPNAHVLAALAGRLTERPVLATVHGRAVTTLDIEVQRLTGSHLAAVCNQSHFQALGIGIDPCHVHFVPNGVDTDRFSPSRPRPAALRARFSVDAAAPLIGFVGRLSPEKGPDLFLRAALAIRAQCARAEFVLVGDGPMLKSLEGFVARFGLREVVHFAGAQERMPEVFNELDVVVSSSLSEAMPLAVMEAMASGVPVVACKVGGIPDLVAHGVTGWLVDAGDCDGMATRVVELLDDRALAEAMAHAARARAVQRLSLDLSVEATRNLYARLTAKAPETNRVSTLPRAARPLRANGAAVKAPLGS
jgi:glycosyltransferase involved in cell wall biosynthesis